MKLFKDKHEIEIIINDQWSSEERNLEMISINNEINSESRIYSIRGTECVNDIEHNDNKYLDLLKGLIGIILNIAGIDPSKEY